MLDETSRLILRKIFVGSASSPTGLNAKRFRADHHEQLKLIDALVKEGYIGDRDGKYVLRLTILPEIAGDTPQVCDLLEMCEQLFKVLRQEYFKNPGERISFADLAKLANLSEAQVTTCVQYLSEASVINGYSINGTASESYVNPAEKVISHNSFSQVIEEIRSWSTKVASTKSFAMPLANLFSMGESDMAFEHLLHPTIAKHALPQYRDGHLRDAVLNSITAVFDLIRERTGLDEDGSKLVGKVFSLDNPYLVLGEIQTESGKSDQQGFMQIFMGAYLGIRNPKAHSLSHDLTPVAAAQYLVFASLLARRIDEARSVSE